MHNGIFPLQLRIFCALIIKSLNVLKERETSCYFLECKRENLKVSTFNKNFNFNDLFSLVFEVL